MFPIESRFSSSQNMKDELMRFFFSKAHESIESNSYEHALVGNWLQRNRGECTVVDVEALDSAEELARSIEAIRDHVATGPFSQKER